MHADKAFAAASALDSSASLGRAPLNAKHSNAFFINFLEKVARLVAAAASLRHGILSRVKLGLILQHKLS